MTNWSVLIPVIATFLTALTALIRAQTAHIKINEHLSQPPTWDHVMPREPSLYP